MRFHARPIPSPSPATLHFLGWGHLLALLLVFFIVSSPGTGLRGLSVELPRVLGGEAVAGALCVVVDKEGAIYFNSEKINPRELEEILSRHGRGGRRDLLVKADRRSGIEALAGVWDAARRAGMEKVYVASGE